MNSGAVTAVIVDDHKDIVDLLCDYIKFYQPEVKIVGKGFDGKEAVRLYCELKPDVIFLDVNMPVYSGIYAIENIRKINPNARIVVISNSVPDELRYQLSDDSIPIIDKIDGLDKLRTYLEKLVFTVIKP